MKVTIPAGLRPWLGCGAGTGRPALEGLYLDPHNGEVVATDGFIIMAIRLEFEGKPAKPAIVPLEAFRGMGGSATIIETVGSLARVRAATKPDRIIEMPLIQASFPDWRAVLVKLTLGEPLPLFVVSPKLLLRCSQALDAMILPLVTGGPEGRHPYIYCGEEPDRLAAIMPMHVSTTVRHAEAAFKAWLKPRPKEAAQPPAQAG